MPVEQNQDRIWYTGPLLYQPFPDLAPDLPTLSTRMPVIFVYGMIHTYEELDRLLVPLRETSCHLLITALPPEMQAATYSDHQLLVTLAPFLDVTQILPMCEAAIIHGGHGSCMALYCKHVLAQTMRWPWLISFPSRGIRRLPLTSCQTINHSFNEKAKKRE